MATLATISCPHFPPFEYGGNCGQKNKKSFGWVDGISLNHLKIVPSEDVLVDWWWQVFGALQLLQTKNGSIVHGDIKPSNLVLRPTGEICLIDFDEVHYASSGHSCVTTAAYAAPELYFGVSTSMSDAFALGATILVIRTGGRFRAGMNYAKIESVLVTVGWKLKPILATALTLDMSKRAEKLAVLAESQRKGNHDGFSTY